MQIHTLRLRLPTCSPASSPLRTLRNARRCPEAAVPIPLVPDWRPPKGRGFIQRHREKAGIAHRPSFLLAGRAVCLSLPSRPALVLRGIFSSVSPPPTTTTCAQMVGGAERRGSSPFLPGPAHYPSPP